MPAIVLSFAQSDYGQQSEKRVRTALPQVTVMIPSVSLLMLLRTMATRMTSMRKTIVDRSAVSRPYNKMQNEVPRRIPSTRLNTTKSVATRKRKAKPHAICGVCRLAFSTMVFRLRRSPMGCRTSTTVRPLEMALGSNPDSLSAFWTLASKL